MVSITTSVDSLVTLVKKKKRISVDDAAKELKLSPEVIMEWANFLEEDKVLAIDYKLTTPFLMDYSLKEKGSKTTKQELELYQTSVQNIIHFLKRSDPSKYPISAWQKKALNQKKALTQECSSFLTTIMNPDAQKREFDKINKHFNIYKKTISRLG